MWAITNCTPFAADRTWGRDIDGIHEWIVAVKATYNIWPDGRTNLADEQLVPLHAPEYYGEPGLSSLRYDADLVAPKPTTDILVNGTAHAPNGSPSKAFQVLLRVGEVHKLLSVVGHRRWEGMGLVMSSVDPVASVPVVYERAYGGYDQIDLEPRRQFLDSRNPVGVGAVANAAHRSGQLAPNFEYPNSDLEKSGPAGFGAIDSHWSPRRELVGTYDADWERTRRPLLPLDWDPRSLQCAPLDQRPHTHLRGGELIELVNLSPRWLAPAGVLRFHLPVVDLVFRTYIDGRLVNHSGQLCTVIIEPDVPRLIMVWLTSIKCRTDGEYLDETVIRQRARS